MNKYNNSKIYTIRCKTDINLIYVGATTQKLCKRWMQHKNRIDNDKYKNILLYAKINELSVDNFYIELYEHFSCDNIEELRKREGELIREIGTLNSRIECRSKAERTKEYRKTDQGKEVSKNASKKYANTEHGKEYYKEYQKNYMPDYYKENKEKLDKYRCELLQCECGCTITRRNLSTHKKSKKHNDLINNI